MKYLKTYEIIHSDGPKVGDYVICSVGNYDIPEWYDKKDELTKFISNNIGVVTHIKKYSLYGDYKIKYEKSNLVKNFCRVRDWKNNTFEMDFNQIKHFSKNKEELEAILAANKYNI